MFPSVIPLYGTDCSRVTHPSAAGISSVQALRISPLDLHVLSTPPAFVLSQDQTLMFNPSTRSRSPSASGSPKPSALIALACCLLSQNLTVPALAPPSVAPPGSLALLFLLCIVFKVRSPPSSRAPQRSHRPSQPRARTRSFQAAVAIISIYLAFVKREIAFSFCKLHIRGARRIASAEGVCPCVGR